MKSCRTATCNRAPVRDSNLCADCLRFTWKHGFRPDDWSPAVERARAGTLPTMVTGGVER